MPFLGIAQCPSAGSDAAIIVCTTDASFALIGELGGSPSSGGNWQAPGGASHGASFNPASHPAGNYTYTIPAGGGCPTVSAILNITKQTPPNAGGNASITVCSTSASFNMRAQLTGSPPAGGTWTDPNGVAHVSTYDPANDIGGVYTYTVSGGGVCSDAVATLTVTKVIGPNAGSNGSLALCNTSGSAQLINSLGGSPNGGGSWTGPSGSHSGTFIPGTHSAGVYTYTVTGTSPCNNATATVTVTVNQQPVAGTNGTTTVCANDPPFNLFTHLGGSPDTGGAWTGPGGNSVSATYTPGTSTPGIYTYTILGQPPCTSATATVTVSQVAPANAGSNASITVCSNDASFSLISQLNGSPSTGGTWVGPNGPHGATFNPAVHSGGAYTYTVSGTSPCSNASAVLNITVRTAPNAGTNASVTVCSTDGSVALVSLLGGNPQGGGTWTGPGGQAHSGTFLPGTNPAGVYTYTVVGQAPCAPATATVTMSVSTAPVAGTGGSLVRCSNAPAFSMIAQLTGSPNAGGTWSGPDGAHSGTFTPGTDPAGAYTYTVTGTAPCANATATLNIAIVIAPNAGSNGSSQVCSNSPQFDLIGVLGGSPSQNGTWTGPGGSASNGNFVPGTSTPGVYTYTVAGQSPCTSAQATATVTVQAMPNAGTNGSITVCSSAAPVSLFDQLGGTPATGGTWTGPGGNSHNGTYQPGSQPGGNYTYTVAGTGPCADASAIVQVVRVIAPKAGTDGTITVCSTNSPFQMLNVLGGGPDGGGIWRNASNVIMNGTFTPGTTAAGTYSYVVNGTAPCVNDTSFVTVNVNLAPNAGTSSAITVCSTAAAFQLITALGGTPTSGGSWTGPNGTAHNGTFTPATSPSGGYTYTVPGQTPCLNATAVVNVTRVVQPVAGTNATFTRCSTAPPVDLMTILGGSPAPGGTWTGPGPLTGSIFTPGTSAPGIYTYTVTGAPPCTNATAQVTAVVNAAPNAGVSGSVTVCQGPNEIDLFSGLAGEPDLNGTWNDDDDTDQLSGNLFSTLDLPTGTYSFTYTVPGIGQCTSAQSLIEVIIVGSLNAGTNGLMNVCSSNTQVNLFNGLNGSPQPGGVWTDLDNTGAQSGQFFNATFVQPGSYQFQYQLTGSVSCASSSATVTVNVTQAPNAGMNGQAVLCSNGAAVQLSNYLSGSPTSGGTWTLNNNTVSGTYNPVVHQPGSYVYTISGSGPCPNAQATVIVSETTAPVAGVGGTMAVCCSDGPFSMTGELTGSPQPGTWSFNGVAHGSEFVPCLDTPGVYVYTVPGQAPCNAATTSLTISVTDASYAGPNNSMVLCSSAAPIVLLSEMTGAQFGGTWTLPDNSTATANHVYVPGSSEPGEYIYTVNGTGPCPADEASLSIFENARANAGDDIMVTFCSNGPSVDLFTLLAGAPDPSGTWTGPGDTPSTGTFVPGTSTPGDYVYVVEGASPCETDSSIVTVEVVPAPNAGTSSLHTVCSSQSAFSMVQQLGGSPQLGGSWQGPLPATTTMDGIFFPGSTPPGVYVYTVQGNAACDPANATLEVVVNQAPNAGSNANLSWCSSGGSVELFPYLGPNAQPGGSWSIQNSSAPFSGTFSPSVHGTAVYVYTVSGLAPCTSHQATISVILHQAPNAGFNGLATICDDASPFTLISQLNGTPQQNGNWTGPLGAHSGTFLPPQDPGGIYTYTVNGTPPCPNATAQVTIIKNEQPNAGQNGVVQICSDQTSFSLFGHLSGSPDPGGSWIGPAPGTTSFSGTFIPGTSQAGVYTYITSALAPCSNDSATVTVIQSIAPNAGCNAASEICSSSGPIPLIGLLGCSPASNGSWTLGVGGPSHGPVFDPAVDGSGTYVYTVIGSSPCVNAVSQVQITLINAPNAGNNGSVAACVDDPAINLFNALGGNFGTGGTWTNLNSVGTLNNGILNATGVAPGSYQFRYVIQGLGPCPNDTAFVTVQITNALNAGDDAAVEVCETQLLDLFDALAGTPQSGGTWHDIDDSNALIAGVFNAGLVPEGSTWRFDYILPSSALCEGDTARVTATVVEGPNAGCSGQVSVCSNGTPLALSNSLGCAPDFDGIWYTPSNTVHSGVFDPAVNGPGPYKYLVPSVGGCPADSAIVTVSIQQAVNAGEDAQVSICSTDTPVILFDLLGDDAQTGGSWFFVQGGIAHPGIYNPAIDSPGTYRYTVPGQQPCNNSFAFVEVTEPAAPNAGCNASVNICSTQDPINMITYLGCGPASGGTWTGPGGEHTAFFDPSSDEPGEYVYLISGVEPCADASATLFVSVTNGSSAGVSATVDACITQISLDLLDALGPTADPGGAWEDLDDSGALSGNIFDPIGAGLGSWTFQYSFPANGPCAATSSTVTVIVGSGANAGLDSSLMVCGADDSFDLFSALGGDPDAGGTWQDLTGSGALLPGGQFDASMIPPGTTVQFGYQIDDPGCGIVTAVITATTSSYLDPGDDATLQHCVTSGPVELFDALGGTPDEGGSWTNPSNAPHSGTFTPGVDPPGAYSYSMPSTPECGILGAQVLVQLIPIADAGLDGEILVCDTVSALDVFTGLGGEPQTNGSWEDLNGVGAAFSNGMLNTQELATGTYSFRYIVDNQECGTDDAIVAVQVIEGVEVGDVTSVCDQQTRTYMVSFPIFGGDPSSYQVAGVDGTITSEPPYVFTSTPIPVSQIFEVYVTDASGCANIQVVTPSPCDPQDGIFVPQSFSPNDDGINDTFRIPGIEGFPSNTVVIFNRWGSKLFEAAGYNNQSIVWHGTSESALMQGKVPAGTYFYVIDLGDNTEALTGYIYLNR